MPHRGQNDRACILDILARLLTLGIGKFGMAFAKLVWSFKQLSHRLRALGCMHIWLSFVWLMMLALQVSKAEANELRAKAPAALELQAVPQVPMSLTEDVARYQNVRSAAVIDWLGDALLISTRFGDTSQLHVVREPLGMREQLTFAAEPIGGALAPHVEKPKRIVFAKDTGGSESYQLFLMDLATRKSDLLTDGKSRYTGVSFDPTGTKIAYSSTELTGRDTDLFIQSLGGERVIVQRDQGVGWYVEDWTQDGSRVLISRFVSVVESELYEVDLKSHARTRLLADQGAVSLGSIAYDAAGRKVFFVSFLDGQFERIYEIDLESGAVAPLSPALNWNVSFFTLSRDRNLLAYVVNEAGYTRTHLLDLASRQDLMMPKLPQGRMSNIRFNHDNSRIAFSFQTPVDQSDVYVMDIATQEVSRWTKSELGEIPAEQMVAPSLKHFKSFDEREIPVFVFEPPGDGPHPVLIHIHGGPESQYRPGFSSTFQFYVNELGIAVWVPNVRGSAGYGKDYVGLDNGYLREDSVKDIGALIDFIATQPRMNADRIGVMGGSYGGYMVLASLVHYSDRIRAGVETVGISNFVTFLENTQDYRRDLRRAEYGDERDPAMREFLESIAPLNRVERITSPLLIGQGLNDPRVPASESRQIFDALQASEVPVWYVLANDEGHGFRKKPNRDYWWYVVAMFLREHLLET